MPDSVDYSRKPVLVLGASGEIGSRLMTALSTGAVISLAGAFSRPSPGGLTLGLDATDRRSMRAALANVDAVINCIDDHRTMVRATEVLCEAARERPAHRIIHLSSMAVYGSAIGTVQEDHATVAPVSRYGQAKIASEHIVRKFVGDGGNAVILRPAWLFGAGNSAWTKWLARLLEARRIGDLGSAGDGVCNLVALDDLVAAVVSSLSTAAVSGRTFNVSSSASLTWNEFFVAFAKALGATPIRRISPRALAVETKLLAPVRRVMAMAAGAPAAITPSATAFWRQDIKIDCAAAAAALDLPQTPPDQMIAAAVRLLRAKPLTRRRERGTTRAEGQLVGSGADR